jgi:acyl-CoA dehydrogenase
MSELARLLADTAERFFSDAWSKGVRGFDAALWNGLAEIGLPRMLLPETEGGAGARWREIQGVFHCIGRFSSSLPLADTVLAAGVLAAGGRSIPDGPLGLSVRCNGDLRHSDGQWRFRGELAGVALHPSTTLIVGVAARGDRQGAIVAEPSRAWNIQLGKNLADEPRARLFFDDAEVMLVEATGVSNERLLQQAALLRCAQISGALLATLERSLDYAANRKQFGRPIGEFQSVRQSLSVFAEECAAVDAACSGAFAAADFGSFAFEVACAKLRANEAIGICTAIAHQVHGAIGFTRDFDLRHFTQRLLSWRTEYGNDDYWAKRLGTEVLARGADSFWSDLTGLSDASARSRPSTHTNGGSIHGK